MSDPTELLKVIDYSATSVRTMKNSAGQIGFAPHNLILASEDFSDSNWTKTDTTVTSNAATAPDGTITADKITADSTSALIQNATLTIPANISLMTGVFLKYADAQWVRVNMNDHNVWVDVQNKVLGTDATEGATLIELSDDWLYVYAPDTSPDTTYVSAIVIAAGDNDTARNNGGSAYIWGAHLYENGLAGMFDVPEDQRALASLTKYLPNKAVVTGPNLVSNGTFDSNTNGWTAYNGGTLSVSSGTLRVTNGASGRAGGYQEITTEIGASYRVQFDAIQGTAADGAFVYVGTNAGNASLGSASNIVATESAVHFTATGTTTYLTLLPSNSTNGDYTDFDNITVTKVDRDPTAARFLPRRENHEYIDGAWVKGLLVESEARTNILPDSFPRGSTIGAVRVTINGSTEASIFGGTQADKVVESTDSNTHYFSRSAMSITSGTTYCMWAIVEAAERDEFALNLGSAGFPSNVTAIYNLTSESVTSSASNADSEGIVKLDGAGRYLVYIVGTADATTSSNIAAWNIANGNKISYLGDGTSGIIVHHIQFEAGSTPSSLIPTYGATRTRTAETFTQKSDKIIWPNTTYVDGTELVTNGGFDSDVSGWTKTDADVTLAQSSGLLQVSHTTASTTRGGYQDITVTANAPYRVTCTVGGDDPQVDLFDGATFAGGSNLKSSTSTIDVVVVPSGTTLRVRVATTDSVSVATFDNISVKEINPRALCVVMHGYMTYADTSDFSEVRFFHQLADANNYILVDLDTNGGNTGQVDFYQAVNGTSDKAESSSDAYSPGVNVPFKIAGRFLDNALQGAADGTSTTENTTPPGLPDLSATQAEWFYDFMGHITDVAVYVEDIEEGGLTALTAKGFPQ